MRCLTVFFPPHRRGAPNSAPVQCCNGSRLKRRAQRAKRRTATASSFPCKPRNAPTKASRGRRLTRRKGSTPDLEHQSQGSPASGQKLRPASRTRWDVRGRVETVERNPPDGMHRATGLYRTRPASPTMSTPLYENASRLQLTPSKGAQVLTWTTR